MHGLGNNYAALVFSEYCAGITGHVEMFLLAPTALRVFVFHWMNWSQIIFYWSQIFFIEDKYFALKPNIWYKSQTSKNQSIESITWLNLSTRIVWNWFQWYNLNWLQIWPPDGAIFIYYKFVDPMAPLALVPNLTTRCHHLHWLPIWPPDGTTCISCIFDHQVAPIALNANLPTRCSHLHLTNS